MRVHDSQADKVEESGSDGEDGSTSASDDDNELEGDEGQAGRRSSAVQKAKAALEQLHGEHRLQMRPTGAFCRLHSALNLTAGHRGLFKAVAYGHHLTCNGMRRVQRHAV